MTAAGNPTPDRVERSRGHLIGSLVVSTVLLAFGVVFIVTAFTLTEPGERVGIAAAFIAAAAWMAYFASASVVISTSRQAVIVRNPFRRITVAFDQLAGFEGAYKVARTGQGMTFRNYFIALRRTDGSRIRCVALSSSGNCAAMAARLNRLVDRPGHQGYPGRMTAYEQAQTTIRDGARAFDRGRQRPPS